MKLWRVTCETYVVVAADDYERAYEHARDAIQREVHEDQFDAIVDPAPIPSVKALPAGWDAQCIPYGDGDGNTRIGKFFE